LQLVLLGAAVVSVVAIQDFHTAIVILAVVLLNAILGLNQEGKAAESVAALQKMLVIKAHARRGGQAPLQRILNTVDLTSRQWGICLLGPLAFLVLAEIGKLVDRHYGSAQHRE
jgi:hypothetical protein